MSDAPLVSIILATHNRRDVVLDTLANVRDCGLAPNSYEILVVDNASTDGTREALAAQPDVRLMPLDENRGACAKGLALERARGAYTLFLDDDSFPRPGCLERMIQLFTDDHDLGVAAFTVHLPDGREECSALPHVFVGCGVGFRTHALRQTGGVDLSFFMAAEEYDTAFRLLNDGWRIDTFAELQVEHRKTPQARCSKRIAFYDIRNNLRLIARYLPDDYAAIYADDWRQRYAWLAQRHDRQEAFARGLAEGRRLAAIERLAFVNQRLRDRPLEQVFCWRAVERRMAKLAAAGVRRVVFADWGKNVYAYFAAARRAGINIAAIGDDVFGAPDRLYRGVPLTPLDAALSESADAIIVSNTSYVHARRRINELTQLTDRPVYEWTRPPLSSAAASLPSTPILR